jgi:protein involved in polysaccharide export with SLBB domain
MLTSLAPFPSRRRLRRVLTLGIATASLVAPAGAQSAGDGANAHYETRAELEAQAQQAEAQHRTGEAWLLRTRLKDGDFQEGDRILYSLRAADQLVEMAGPGNRLDTLIVRAGKMIQFPSMADLSLAGVLRSELADRITKHLSTYIHDPVVHVSPLLRIGVLGHVVHQGYFYASPDVLLTDLLMQAGGMSGDGDLRDVTIHRGSDVIWKAADVRTAFSDGLSLDRLHLRAGDEVEVGAQSKFSWMSVVQVGASLVAIVTAVVTLQRIR